MGARRGAYRFWWGNLREGGHLEDPGMYGRIILKWIFNSRMGRMDWIDLTGRGQVASCFECGNEP